MGAASLLPAAVGRDFVTLCNLHSVCSRASWFRKAWSVASCFSLLVSAGTFPVSGDNGMEASLEFGRLASIAAVEKGDCWF